MNDFNELINGLCRPFPSEVMQPRHDGHGVYIPIRYYIERLNQVAGDQWSHERIGEPIFYEEDKFVHTVVKVTIMGRSHVGEGFSRYQTDDKGKIINRHYAIRSATKDGIRDAISFFGIGRDLESFTKPTVAKVAKVEGSERIDHTTQKITCIKCDKELSDYEVRLLQSNNVKLTYCEDHIPSHFFKK
ncbi:hypothetical protein [Alkalihalophilus marmarensis]|uniref:hypothetical protein n=1 Tax=Alkalihalophilus marmarensis TaxID=521377 RepID=UPI002DB91C73|nr:hypothetical protein [Alkalihalophilus marmarensis]MEC2074278.1 Rad52/Rad22 family DNA repair protein [Alkalihalophilus marmarensis]